MNVRLRGQSDIGYVQALAPFSGLSVRPDMNGRSQGPVDPGLTVVDRTGLARVRRERYCYEDWRSIAVRLM
jgi:hypothetical protein